MAKTRQDRDEGARSALFDDAFLKTVERLHIVSKKMAAGAHQATRRSRKLGAGIEVRDFRRYVAGDDLRHVDWNYYASSRERVVRLFEEEEDLHIYFLLDVSASMQAGDGAKLRYAKELVGALSYIALANLDRAAVIPFARAPLRPLPPSRGRAQIWKVFRFLEALDLPERGPAAVSDLEGALKTFVSRTRRRGLAVVLSDFYDPRGIEAGVNALRYHRFEPMLLHVWDEREATPQLDGDLQLVDCETGAAVRVTVTPGLLERYRRAHESQRAEVARFAKSKAALHFGAPVQLAFDELVLRVFRAGGFLR